MGPVFAALGGAVAAILEVTVVSRIHIADAQPQIALVIAVLLTLMIGFEEGMAWAFVAGLFLDFLAFRPLGTTVFGLLIVVGLTAAASPFLLRIRVASPLIGVVAFTPVFIIITSVTTGLLKPPAPSLGPTHMAAAALANAITAALVAPVFAALRRRWDQPERLSW
jgi:rod shape-determining protein MreD